MQSVGLNIPSLIAQGIAFVILAATVALLWYLARALIKRSKSN